ncbi:hypothetical protein [Roseateles sp.]|uniref:hypothetical protein n=1 Tax=Roseateles sp. TaxID=1971397 RepID=UPI00286D202E|nr:hypothetical protein [Roseateles sp.]
MSCVDKKHDLRAALIGATGIGLMTLLTGCSDSPRVPVVGPAASSASANSSNATLEPGPARPQPPASGPKTGALLPAPKPPRSHDELRLQAAHRLVAANPQQSYMGSPPEILLAIPVLEVNLNRDGSIKRIVVLRRPSQEQGTVQLAIDALYRAAPYGDLSTLPGPWRFTETFLFNDELRFKPRSLD